MNRYLDLISYCEESPDEESHVDYHRNHQKLTLVGKNFTALLSPLRSEKKSSEPAKEFDLKDSFSSTLLIQLDSSGSMNVRK